MLKYITSTLILLIGLASFAQEETAQAKDTLIKTKYGIRVGVDLFNPVSTFINEDRKGLELAGDYRISDKWYVAAELGYLDNKTEEDFFDFSTSGSYIKAGVNYNAYENWLDMQNEIFVGFRYGFSAFSQTLENYTINNDPFFDEFASLIEGQKFESLNAHWVEFMLGIKAEVLNNLYLGFGFSGKKMITTKEPDGFKNLFVPGFNRVYLNNFGFGFNYTVSYLIPLYKKAK